MRKRGRSAKAAGQAPEPVAARLAWYFERNGYLRWANAERREAEGSEAYKKGDEVRLVAESRGELATIRRLLRTAGFAAGRPFRKARQYRQPVYGRHQVARFLEMVGTCPIRRPERPRRRRLRGK